MHTVTARNTNGLMAPTYHLLKHHGVRESSRNGDVLRIPDPVLLRTTLPEECVNFCSVRDANPFFHFMESLAILGAHNSVEWLSFFNSKIAGYSDNGRQFNAFYGTRLRVTWGDQVEAVIQALRADPETRRAVINLWDPADLSKDTRDMACNVSMTFEIRGEFLNLTVFNRSNDAIWGTVCGANVVQFSFLQSYVAGALQVHVGRYDQISANLHVYVDNPQWRLLQDHEHDSDCNGNQRVNHASYVFMFCGEPARHTFYQALQEFVDQTHNYLALKDSARVLPYVHTLWNDAPFIAMVAVPMFNAWAARKAGLPLQTVYRHLRDIACPAWRFACYQWVQRREARAIDRGKATPS